MDKTKALKLLQLPFRLIALGILIFATACGGGADTSEIAGTWEGPLGIKMVISKDGSGETVPEEGEKSMKIKINKTGDNEYELEFGENSTTYQLQGDKLTGKKDSEDVWNKVK